MSEGQRIDQFYEAQTPTIETIILGILQKRFSYIECVRCNRLLETGNFLTKDLIKNWKFDPTSLLKPSILRVAKATCPFCQEFLKQFNKVLHE